MKMIYKTHFILKIWLFIEITNAQNDHGVQKNAQISKRPNIHVMHVSKNIY